MVWMIHLGEFGLRKINEFWIGIEKIICCIWSNLEFNIWICIFGLLEFCIVMMILNFGDLVHFACRFGSFPWAWGSRGIWIIAKEKVMASSENEISHSPSSSSSSSSSVSDEISPPSNLCMQKFRLYETRSVIYPFL